MPNENQDLNKDEVSQSDEGGQSSEETQGDGSQEESVTLTKEEHEKLVRERDGYKAQALKKQATKDLSSHRGEDNKGDGSDGAGESKSLDDDKIKNLVKQELNEYSSSTKKALQSRAQEEFLREYPELVGNEASHDEVLSHLALRGDELTVTDYKKRLRSAYLLWKDERGELDDYLSKEKERASRQARIQAEIDTGRETGRSGDERAGKSGSPSLTPKGEEIARGMKVDPARAAKVQYGKDNVIDILAPRR